MFTRPKDKNNLIFFWLPYSGLGKAVAGINSGSAMQWDTLAFLPHPTDITDIAPPPLDHSPLFAWIRGLVKRVWPAPDQWLRDQMAACWAGFTSPVAMSCMCFVLLRCFPVLTLYSPRSIVWGLFFSPPFPHVNAVFFFNSTCISLLIILVWLCMWRIIKNLEPWTLDLYQNCPLFSFFYSHKLPFSLYPTKNLTTDIQRNVF